MNENSHSILWEQFEQAAAQAKKQGNFVQAARILKEALREAEEYGEITPNLITAAHSLAELHLAQHRYKEAEALYRLVLEVREKLLGPTHQDVVDSLKKVAIVQIMSFRAEALGRRSAEPVLSFDDMMAIASQAGRKAELIGVIPCGSGQSNFASLSSAQLTQPLA